MLADKQKLTYIICVNTGCHLEGLPRAMARESKGISAIGTT